MRSDAPELAAFGAYAVGVQTLDFVHPAQVDILNSTDAAAPLYDRPLKVEVWYPAAPGTRPGGRYACTLRDGRTQVTLNGRAARDAPPNSGEAYPLVVISHGYPGNRFLMSHLGENLASKGYVAVSIDHTDSTYSDQAGFGSTLFHRPNDQRFIVDQMATLGGALGAIVDAQNTGVIGFSMGGYGALVYGGAGVCAGATDIDRAPPGDLLNVHLSQSASHNALIDPRIKAIIPIGPWGMNAGIWDASGLALLRKPMLLIAGSVDDVSDYPSMRRIFDQSVGTERHLLTFENANHNAAAPIPAPEESWTPVDHLDFVPAEHYCDPVWDTVRMNNITQHFCTAFLDLHLKNDAQKAAFLDLVPKSSDGIFGLESDGTKPKAHAHWAGFAPRTAVGLRFETKYKGQ
jgi:predicted dienelactone hydrolase